MRIAALIGIGLFLSASPGWGEGLLGISFETPAGAPAHVERDLNRLSLEELLDIQLDRMSLTGIHHTHDAGEWMVGVSSMFMGMDGNQSGSRELSRSDVWGQGYMVAPTAMDMQMHMFHLMGAPSDHFTFALMMPYLRKSMDHQVDPALAMPFAGQKFTTRSEGPGDLSLRGIFRIVERESHRLMLEAGATFPTGSIDEKDTLPNSMGQRVRLPYPMQLGSGTYDLLPGATYIGRLPGWQWGVHASGVIRTGHNDHGYRLGDEWRTTAWGARALGSLLSSSLRLEARGWGDISGDDDALNPAMVPTADPDLRAGERIDALLGINLFADRGWLDGQRLSVEAGLPIYQRLDGPQLAGAWQLRLSWDWSFRGPFSGD